MLEMIQWIIALFTLIATDAWAFIGFLIVCAIIVFTINDNKRVKANIAKQQVEAEASKQTKEMETETVTWKQGNARKHRVMEIGNGNTETRKQEIGNNLTCKCGKQYQTRSGLWKHQQKCNQE